MTTTALVLHPANMVFPLSADQRETYEIYTSDTLFGCLRRDLRYLSLHPNSVAQLRNRILTAGGFGVLLGGALTYFAMSYIKPEEETSTSESSTLKITAYGAAIGGGIGSLVSATRKVKEMERSKEYATWRAQAIRDKVFPLFQQFLEKSDVIENFLCPITRDLITTPVRDPKGRVYEQDAIFAWIDRVVPYTPEALARLPTEADRDRVRFRTSPFCDMALTKADLTSDTDYHTKISVALKALFDQKIDQQFREGLLNYQASMIHDRETLLKFIVTDLTTKHVSGRIPEDEFIEACRSCRKHYSLAL